MSSERPKIIISEDGRTYSFDRHGSEHEFYTIAGLEEAISTARAKIDVLKKDPIASDQEIRVLEEDIRRLEVQRQLAKISGI